MIHADQEFVIGGQAFETGQPCQARLSESGGLMLFILVEVVNWPCSASLLLESYAKTHAELLLNGGKRRGQEPRTQAPSSWRLKAVQRCVTLHK